MTVDIDDNRLDWAWVDRTMFDWTDETVLVGNALKRFLLIDSFYNSNEYFKYQRYSIEN